MFKEIGKKFKIDAALLPIAPVEPRSLMRRVHMDPAQAVQAMEDLQARAMIPIHYRTLRQGSDSSAAFAQDLLEKIIAEKKIREPGLHSHCRRAKSVQRFVREMKKPVFCCFLFRFH